MSASSGSTAPSSTPPSTVSPPPSSAPPGDGGRRASRRLLGAVVAVVIIVLLIVALLFSGVIPGFSLAGSGGGGGGGGTRYSVTFSETGLPAGTSWSVTLGGSQQSSTTGTIVFQMANGTYSWTASATGYSPTPASGSLAVAGASVSKSLSFSVAVSYTVSFTESGLPSGTSWSVTLGGTPKSSSTSSIVFSEYNGTYAWSASATGYTGSPSSGSLTVAGANQSQAVTFTANPAGTYTVTFTESGLPSGASWSVTFNGSSLSSTTASIAFTSPNGTWPFTVGAVSGYTSSPASGNVQVSGAAASQAISFTSNGGGGAQTYSQAKPIADGVAGAHSSSPKLVVADAIDSRNSFTNNTSNLTNVSCPLTGGSISSFTFPTFTGNYHSGESPLWIFIYYQASPAALLFAAVINGQGSYVGEISGSGCVNSVYGNITVPSSVVDSPAAGAAAAATTNGSAFVSAHAQADAAYSLVGGYSYSVLNFSITEAPMWNVVFSTCMAGYTGSGTEYTAAVNATNGAVISDSTTSVTCSGSAVYAPHSGASTGPVVTARSEGLLALCAAPSPRE